MDDQQEQAYQAIPDEIWLGYADLIVPFADISAVLVYQPAWDRRIVASYGSVPADARAVVLLHNGHVLPARRALADLRQRWLDWRAARPHQARAPRSPGDSKTNQHEPE